MAKGKTGTKIEVVITPQGVEKAKIKTSEPTKAAAFYLGLEDELKQLHKVAQWAWFWAEEQYEEIFGEGETVLEGSGGES